MNELDRSAPTSVQSTTKRSDQDVALGVLGDSPNVRNRNEVSAASVRAEKPPVSSVETI